MLSLCVTLTLGVVLGTPRQENIFTAASCSTCSLGIRQRINFCDDRDPVETHALDQRETEEQ